MSIGESLRIPSVCGYRVVRSYPHDPEAFTQGLIRHNGFFYESVGEYGRSELRKVEPASGRVLARRRLDDSLWAEGIALVGADRIVQLTWRQHRGFVCRRNDLSVVSEFEYDTEGWGLASDGNRLIMSDGTDQLYWLDPDALVQRPLVRVTSAGVPVRDVNELQMIGDDLYANILDTDRIARIDLATGAVIAWMDLSGLDPYAGGNRPGGAVLNGVAYDRNEGKIFVAGKLWPEIHEVEFVCGSP
ncbi:glutaminyl-peptide cyclotransferase [Kutzneria sp. NPDC052558]|uniref:glutaminyl-peptide cyclotransferase n=1 Tax=Kutzneria sp. NPDC052558 TaxID=3364121 RepID=UPI0037C54178